MYIDTKRVGGYWLTSRVQHLLDRAGDAGGIAADDELEAVVGDQGDEWRGSIEHGG